MPRGERIGEAYIRIFADGGGLDESIRRQFGDAEPVTKKAAQDHADIWGDEFNKQYRKSFKGQWDKTQKEMVEEINKGAAKGFARMQLADNFFRSKGWRDFRGKLIEENGVAGEIAADNLAERFRRSAALGQLPQAVERIGEEMAKAEEQAVREAERLQREANKRTEVLNRAHAAALIEDRRRIQRLGLMQEQAIAEDRRRELDRELAIRRLASLQIQAYAEDERRTLADEMAVRRLANLQMQAQAEDERRTLGRTRQQLQDLRDEYARLTIAVHHYSRGERDALRDAEGNRVNRADMIRQFENIRGRMREAGIMTVQFSDGIDRSTGRLRTMNPHLDKTNRGIDSFANVLGVSFGRGSRNDFLNFIGSLVRNIARLPRLFVSAAKFATNWVDSIRAAQGAGAKLSAALRPAVGALAGFAAIALAGVLIIGPLAAAMSMLAGVAVALAGSITFALIGAVGALAGAFVPLVAGIGVTVLAFRNMPKEARTAFRSLRREFSGLGELAGRNVFANVTNQVERFRGVIGNLRPLVRNIGREISGLGDFWLDALESPAFSAFRREITAFLPRAVGQLGRSIINSMGGFGGLLRGMIPITQRFLTWLEKITGEFTRWANSPLGQGQIKNFMDRAASSAKALGGFLKEVGGLLMDLLSAGRGAGDTLLGDMTRAVQGWREALRADPDILRRWFNDAVAFGRAVGTLIVAVGRLFDALDNPATRAIATLVFDQLALSVRLLGAAFRVPIINMGFLLIGIGKLMNGINKLTPMSDPFGDWGDSLQGFGRDMIGASNNTDRLTQSIRGTSGASSEFRNNVKSMRDSLDQVTGAATAATRKLIQQRLITSGAADSFGAYGISMRDAVGSVLGLESAQRRVTAALLKARPAMEGMAPGALRAKLNELSRTFGLTSAQVRNLYRETTIWGNAVNALPRRKQMVVSASGMPKTLGQFRDLVRDAKLVPKQIKPLVKAAGIKVTDKELAGLIRLARNLDRQKPKPKADLDKKPFDRNKKAVDSALKNLNRQKPIPKTDLNKRALDLAVRRANTELSGLGRRSVSPRVNVNPGNSFGTLNALQAGLNAIRSKTVTATVVRRVVGGNRAVASGGMFTPMAAGGVQGLAAGAGGMINSRTFTGNGFMLGESGREAVVPLQRPLMQVDPAVRWLSAIAQGKGEFARPQKVVDVGGLTVITPTRDPVAVANETVNQLVGKGY